MVIECDACGARYGLDRELIRGYRAARVRCRRCGGQIDVEFPAHPKPLENAAPGSRHDLEDPSRALTAASASPRPELRASGRAIPATASALPLTYEEAWTEVAPDNLVDLHAFREAYRRKMLAGVYDISRHLTVEIPYPELPFAAAKPSSFFIEAPGRPEPTGPDVDAQVPTAIDPVLPKPEEPLPAGRPGILEEPFPWKEEDSVALRGAREEPLTPRAASRRRRIRQPGSARFAGTGIMVLFAVCGTAIGVLFMSLLIRFFTR